MHFNSSEEVVNALLILDIDTGSARYKSRKLAEIVAAARIWQTTQPDDEELPYCPTCGCPSHGECDQWDH